MFPETIFSYITQEENRFESEEITVGDNWRWSWRNHVQMIFHLKHGQFFTGENGDFLRAFKNIMDPVLSLAYWMQDLEVKDVLFYIENTRGRILSFLVKRYHDDVYVKEHNLDEMFDEITESDVDYGGVMVDVADRKRPKVLALTKVAFADQTEALGGPVGFKLYFSPATLRGMEKNGWGKAENGAQGSINDLIVLASQTKDPEGGRKGDKENVTTGKNIEVYIVRGGMPKGYLDDSGDLETVEEQVQIVAAYYDEKKSRHGFTLYRKQGEGTLKFYASQTVPGRAIGYGFGERMLHPQIWTNFLEIHKMSLLQAGSKNVLFTDDETLTNRNQVQDMEQLEVMTIKENRTIGRVPTMGTENIQLFQNAIDQWFEFSQYAGKAHDPLLGKEPNSGTTFRGQERTVAQGRGPHDRLRGKRAKFIEEIYRDAILPEIKREILKGKKFLATLSADEMQWVTDQLAENHANRKMMDAILDGKDPGDKEMHKEEFKASFAKKGSQHLIEILKDEFRDVEIKMGINVAGKQKDLVGLSDKVLSIFQFIFANPPAFQQAMQIPGMSKAFGDILEFSGINQTDFTTFAGKMTAPPQNSPQPSPQMLPAPEPATV